MKRATRMLLLLVIAVVFLLALASCKQLIYYLEQVQKVYGKVTLAGSNGETPICSVEVFVGDFQYSELTNYCGDYELEMAKGTWTINFRKEGYEPYGEEVTVSAENPRVRLDVELVWIEPPWSMSGYWLIFLQEDGEYGEYGPSHLMYVEQTGSTFEGNFYGIFLSGGVDGTAVTLYVDPGTGPKTWTGARQEDGSIILESGLVLLEPLDPEDFGTMELSGLVDLSPAPGIATQDEDRAGVGIDFIDLTSMVRLNIEVNEGWIGAGTYTIGDQLDQASMEVEMTKTDGFWLEGEAVSGEIVITRFEENVWVEAYFEDIEIDFEDNESSGSQIVSGSFNAPLNLIENYD